MSSSQKRLLHCLQFGAKSLSDRFPPDDETSAPARPPAVMGEPQEVERFRRDAAQLGFLLVDREFQPPHHVPHGRLGLWAGAAAANHEVVGVVHDASLKLLLVSQRFPTQHETPHVQIR